jgi:integrase
MMEPSTMPTNHRTCRRGPRKVSSDLWKRGNVYYSRFCYNGRQIRKRLHSDREIAEEMLAELKLATCKRAGIETRTEDADGNVVEFVGLHSTRHTFCTHLIMAGQSPKTVQELMGHKTLDMTMKVYSKVFPENKRAAIDQLSYGAGPAETPDVIRLQR